jgi:hypothetical protein
MQNAEVRDGIHVAAEIEHQFRDDRIAYIQLHHAKPGFFSGIVELRLSQQCSTLHAALTFER